jgi:hypothetical protein
MAIIRVEKFNISMENKHDTIIRLVTCGDRAFAPRLWNKLPVEQIATETSFQPKSPFFQEEPENIPFHSTGQQTIPLRYSDGVFDHY